ncbi:Glycerol-3-phosphate dehydrogenase [NAD(+)], cytoplasmic, partial [Dryobates pubescens]
VAEPDLLKACAGADILLFVVPHQFIAKVCDQLKGHVKKEAVGMSLIKGVDEGPQGLRLISDIIHEKLGIEMSVLMGANIASEVAEEKFCETTIGCKNLEHGQELKELMQTPNFRVTVVKEADTVEICGALKVGELLPGGCRACGSPGLCWERRGGAASWVSPAGCYPVAQTRLWRELWMGLVELLAGMMLTGTDSASVGSFQSLEQLEKEMLNGQKLQGPQTSAELHRILQSKNAVEKFPLFTAVYRICYEGKPVTDVIQCLQNHPVH